MPKHQPQTAPPKAKEPLPAQPPLGDEPAPRPPAKWKKYAKRALTALGVLLALAAVYLFLLLGEPSEESTQTAQQTAAPEESIRVPMAAVESAGDADLSTLAANFGKPLLALYGTTLPLQKAALNDTAFRGGYARRVTLTYAFADGQPLLCESLRPTAAVELLRGDYHLRASSLYAIAGLDAVRMENDAEICVFARSEEAVYAILSPASHSAELDALLKQTTLWQAAAAQ